ncbi:unnamed protein product, partial [Ixodes pacificus]
MEWRKPLTDAEGPHEGDEAQHEAEHGEGGGHDVDAQVVGQQHRVEDAAGPDGNPEHHSDGEGHFVAGAQGQRQEGGAPHNVDEHHHVVLAQDAPVGEHTAEQAPRQVARREAGEQQRGRMARHAPGNGKVHDGHREHDEGEGEGDARQDDGVEDGAAQEGKDGQLLAEPVLELLLDVALDAGARRRVELGLLDAVFGDDGAQLSLAVNLADAVEGGLKQHGARDGVQGEGTQQQQGRPQAEHVDDREQHGREEEGAQGAARKVDAIARRPMPLEVLVDHNCVGEVHHSLPDACGERHHNDCYYLDPKDQEAEHAGRRHRDGADEGQLPRVHHLVHHAAQDYC